MVEKRTMTLEDGTIVDCGVKEFNAMIKAVKEGTPRDITFATVRVMMSSEKMMGKLIKDITEGIKKFTKEYKESQQEQID